MNMAHSSPLKKATTRSEGDKLTCIGWSLMVSLINFCKLPGWVVFFLPKSVIYFGGNCWWGCVGVIWIRPFYSPDLPSGWISEHSYASLVKFSFAPDSDMFQKFYKRMCSRHQHTAPWRKPVKCWKWDKSSWLRVHKTNQDSPNIGLGCVWPLIQPSVLLMVPLIATLPSGMPLWRLPLWRPPWCGATPNKMAVDKDNVVKDVVVKELSRPPSPKMLPSGMPQ